MEDFATLNNAVAARAAVVDSMRGTVLRGMFARARIGFDVERAVAAEIRAGRDPNPLRRRFLDVTMATASPVAIASGMGWL